jgi:Rrf2 family protein
MKIITKDVDYAVAALLYMNQTKDKPVAVSELVNKLKISRSFLRKILQHLAKGKILHSLKGKNGGFVLAVEARNILLSDLVNMLHGEISIIDCSFKGEFCLNQRACTLRVSAKSIEENIKKQLKGITIASLSREVA